MISVHNFSVGYSYRTGIWKDKLQLGGFVKAGLALIVIDGSGEGTSSSGLDNGAYNLIITPLTGPEVLQDRWSPTTTVGVSATPVWEFRKVKDRLSLNVAATMVWKDPYVAFAKTEYSLARPGGTEEGVIQYRGRPLLLQVGVDYRLFRFGKRE
jgi:hypothetical protein